MDPLQRMEKALGAAADAGDVDAARQIAADMRAMLKSVNPNVDAPVDHAAEGARQVAKETGVGEAMLVGAGRGADKLLAGIEQAAQAARTVKVPGYPDLPTKAQGEQRLGEIKAEQDKMDSSYAPLARERPIATTFGETAPYAAVPGGVAASSATVAALEGAKYGTPQERLGRAVVGGGSTAAGGMLARGIGNFLAPVTKKAAGQANQEALAAAERLGVQPTLGEATGFPLLRRLEDYAARVPGGAGVMADFAAKNQTAINRAAASAVGEVADEMTPSVFAAASKRLGKVFEDIKALGGRPIQIGANVSAAADDILRQQAKMLPGQQDEILIKLANHAKALAANKAMMDGEAYQLARSGLSDAAFEATGSNKAMYGRLLSALDDSADASLRAGGQEALADALKTARPQYANLKMLEKGATAEAGNVSPARVASTMRTQNPGAFRRGDFIGTPMRDIATVGEGMKPLRAGSATMEREALSNPLSIATNALWSYPIAKMATSPVVSMYPRALGAAGLSQESLRYLTPAGRTAVAAALQESGVLPLLPASHQ